MKSKLYVTNWQAIIGENNQSVATGFILLWRPTNTNDFNHRYSNGTAVADATYSNFFQGLDDQWIHIVTVCDYTNKTAKAYRNGIQFGATVTLTGTPVFPSTNNVKYIGAYNTNQRSVTDGSLDEVRIYNRGLSDDEVMAIYNQTKSNYE